MGPEILIVGDRVHRSELIPRVQDLGYTVAPVRERDLLQRVGQTPAPAAVIVCLGAPDTAGLVKSLRRTREGAVVPVLVVGKLDGDGLADVLELGADRFLETPLDVLELEEALAELAGPAETAPRPRPRPRGAPHEGDPALSQIHQTLEILAARLETGEDPSEGDGIDLDAMGLDAVPNVDAEHASVGEFELPRAAGRPPTAADPTLQLPKARRWRHEISGERREADAPAQRDALSERTAPVATASREDVRRDKSLRDETRGPDAREGRPLAPAVREVTAKLPSARPGRLGEETGLERQERAGAAGDGGQAEPGGRWQPGGGRERGQESAGGRVTERGEFGLAESVRRDARMRGGTGTERQVDPGAGRSSARETESAGRDAGTGRLSAREMGVRAGRDAGTGRLSARETGVRAAETESAGRDAGTGRLSARETDVRAGRDAGTGRLSARETSVRGREAESAGRDPGTGRPSGRDAGARREAAESGASGRWEDSEAESSGRDPGTGRLSAREPRMRGGTGSERQVDSEPGSLSSGRRREELEAETGRSSSGWRWEESAEPGTGRLSSGRRREELEAESSGREPATGRPSARELGLRQEESTGRERRTGRPSAREPGLRREEQDESGGTGRLLARESGSRGREELEEERGGRDPGRMSGRESGSRGREELEESTGREPEIGRMPGRARGEPENAGGVERLSARELSARLREVRESSTRRWETEPRPDGRDVGAGRGDPGRGRSESDASVRVQVREPSRVHEGTGSPPPGTRTEVGEDEAPVVLTRLRRERFTGCLQVHAAGGPERRLWWSEGQVIGGESEAASESVLGRLRARGLLDARDLAVVARWSGGDVRRDVERLAQGRFIKPQEVKEALREPVRRIVEAIVASGAVGWALYPESRPGVAVELGVPLAALLAGGVRRGVPLERLRVLVVDERRPRLQALHGPSELNFAVPEALAAEMRWPALVAITGRFDGQTGVGRLVAEAIAEESEIRAAVYVLELLGHLAPETEDEEADLVALDRRRVRERLRLARESDYFTLLGLDRGATRAEVLRAHADLTATFSEGLEPASREELAGELDELRAAFEEARDVLSDEALHSAYLAQVGEP